MNDDTPPQIESRSSGRNGTGVPLPSSATQATATSQADGLQQEHTDASVQDARDTNESDRDSASIVAAITQRQLPSRREIAAAIIEDSKARGRQLIAGETLDMAHPFSVFSRLEVEKIKVKHERGSITLEVSEAICQEDGRILPARTMEHELSIIRRSDGVWIISDPQERTYMPEEDALEIFEHQAGIISPWRSQQQQCPGRGESLWTASTINNGFATTSCNQISCN